MSHFPRARVGCRVLCMALFAAGLGGVLSGQTVTRFPLPTASSGPFGIASGPDGNLWFAENGSNAHRVGRITPSGVITEFTIPSATLRPTDITRGPDGALWFTEAASSGGDRIGRITTAGVITEFPLPLGVGGVRSITNGPDGNLWFTDGFSHIMRMTTAGVVTQFPLPWSGAGTTITTGPDGNLWFTDVFGSNSIGRMTPAGVATQFIVPTPSAQPDGIVSGPDGNLWFTERTGGNIGRITTDGVITEFPTTAISPRGITVGADGNLWFAERTNRIGRITTTGVITEFTLPAGVEGDGITQGPDGHLWLTSFLGNEVWRFIPGAVAPGGGQTFTEYRICSTPNSSPDGIRSGPDGALWFVEGQGNNVGRITTAGDITEFPIPTPNAQPEGIGVGPDGNLWFAETNVNRIGRITPAGVITEFPIPSPNTRPIHISSGPDGALWFTENLGNRIGRITTAGAITEFPLPSPNSGPQEVLTGPDGNLWFTEITGNRIGRLTVGGVFTEFPVPTPNSGPADLAVGSDGALWFTESTANRIGRITTAGTITEFVLPNPGSEPFGITSGPDGALWFTELAGNRIGRITTGGAITEFPIPTPFSTSYGITSGPDGALWFTEYAGNKIGRLTASGPATGNRFVSPSFPILVDTNGSGQPGTGDTAVLLRRFGSVLTILGPWEDCPGGALNTITGSNPHPTTGASQTFTRIHDDETEQITVGGFTPDNRPTTATMQVTGPSPRNGSGSTFDSNGDGIADGVQGTESGGGGLNFMTSFVFSDVTGDGRADYASIPWAQTSLLGVQPIPGLGTNPQVWVPLADTNGDGVPDSVAFDLNADGVADSNVFVSPVLRPSPVISPLAFHTVAPCRVIDTRNAGGPLGGPALLANTERTFAVTGQCGIPLTASAISANVTVTQPTDQGDLRLFPGGTPLPLVSTMNYRAGQTRANNAILVLGPGGDFVVRCVQVSGTTHFILDVNGYFAAGAGVISSAGSTGFPPSVAWAGSALALFRWALIALTLLLCPVAWLRLKQRGLET